MNNLNNKRKVIQFNGQATLKGINKIGKVRRTSAHSPLETHIHPNLVEISYLVKGKQTFCLNNKKYKLKGGDIFITFPGEVHGTGKNPREKSILYWFNFDPISFKNELIGLQNYNINTLIERITGLKKRYFKGTTEIKKNIDEIFNIYYKKD
ncbi:MAG: AraC family ligand binding domain-containing protein [bacterium]